MATDKRFTGYLRQYKTVPAYSMLTVDFAEPCPNYFKIQNHGNSSLFCSTNNFPTKKQYDFMVDGGGGKLWVEPYKKSRIYIYNPSAEDMEIIVVSFYAEFDPVTLAMSELKFDLEGQLVETTGTISAFETALPAGSNLIGSVNVANGMTSAQAANILDKLSKIESKTFDKWYVSPDVYMVSAELASGATVEETGTTLDLGAATKFHISFFTNDHETENISLLIDGWNGVDSASQKVIKLKPGETLNDFGGICKKISVRGVGMSARYILYYKVV